MTERAIKEALNEGMLAKARSAAAAEQYAEAFEYTLAVLAVDEDYLEGHVLLIVITVSFLTNPLVRTYLLPLMGPRHPDVGDLQESFASVNPFTMKEVLLADASLPINREARASLLVFSRAVFHADLSDLTLLPAQSSTLNGLIYDVRKLIIRYHRFFFMREVLKNIFGNEFCVSLPETIAIAYREVLERMGSEAADSFARALQGSIEGMLAASHRTANVTSIDPSQRGKVEEK